jgi:NAD(P)-dependent dehydrogenase (short-subunit alcohol dehydrogenase family)
MNTWIIGLGGIGSAIKDLLVKHQHHITCFSNHMTQCPVDLNSERSITDYVNQIDTLPDNVIITCGLLYSEKYTPEKSIKSVNKAWLMQSIEANVLPALYFIKALTSRLNQSHTLNCAIFSARVSSISDNRLGGWHSYRMSKCMLNMLIKNTALEWRVTSPKSIIFGYHPGTVNTHLSKPFQKKLTSTQLFTADKAANYFTDCLSNRTPNHSGKLFDWQQLEIKP